MKISKIIKAIFLSFLFFPLISKSSWAAIDSGIDCGPPPSQETCDEKAPGTTCREISGRWTCVLVIPPSSLEKFQQELKNCNENGTTSMECWIGGPEQVAEEPDKASTGVMPAVANSLTTMIIGPIPSIAGESYRPGGAIGGITNLIAAMYANPPASSVEYFADLGKNLGIVKPAYAQAGVGFQSLRPILPLWKAFRNIAYLFFTIVFVVIGFAIMFRVKLDPQTVISVQNAIPRVVIALILVTFSYAIAGLLIDLIYILISLLISVLGTTGYLDNAKAQKVYLNASILTLLGAFLTRGSAAAKEVSNILNPATWLPETIKEITDGLNIPMLELPSNLLALILSAILLISFFKLFLNLLYAYVRILTGIVFGPLQIMLGVLPNQDSFLAWFKNLLSNIAIFPAVVGMFLLADVILEATKKSGFVWAPPFIQVRSPGAFIGSLIAYGIFLMIPKVSEIVKAAFEHKPFPYGTAIGEAMRPISRPLGYTWGLTKEVGGKVTIGYLGSALGYGWGFGAGKTRETTNVKEEPPNPESKES